MLLKKTISLSVTMGLCLLILNSSLAAFDVNCDGQEGIAEVIHALQVSAGYNPGTENCEAQVPTVTSLTGRVWMDRNLGASRVATSLTDTEAYGDLYQWGRLTDGHEKRNSTNTTVNSALDVPGHGNFIVETVGPYDWRQPQNDSLWLGESGINNPCPDGFRLPTYTELENEFSSWVTQDSTGAFASPLKLPAAGYRDHMDGSIGEVGVSGYYWTGSDWYGFSESLSVHNDGAYMFEDGRAYGLSIRCIKN